MGNGERKRMVLGRALAVLYRGLQEGLSRRKLRESKRASHVGRGSAKDLKRSMPGVRKEQQRPVRSGSPDEDQSGRRGSRREKGLEAPFTFTVRMGSCYRRAEALARSLWLPE